MATPKEGYYVDGKRVPGVTTVLGRFKESGGLIHWSWKIPFDGLTEARSLLEDTIRNQDSKRIAEALNFLEQPLSTWDYRTKRDTAADAGTCAHDMMECHIKGRVFDSSHYPPEVVVRAQPAYEAFLQWAKQSKFEISETEVQLTSRKYLFGGTRDAILIDGKRSLGDWKTSNAIYPEYLLQLGAYGILDEEAGNTIEGGYHLLRFSKQEKPDDPVQFSHHYWSQLDKAKKAFLLMRELYDLMSEIKKLAR